MAKNRAVWLLVAARNLAEARKKEPDEEMISILQTHIDMTLDEIHPTWRMDPKEAWLCKCGRKWDDAFDGFECVCGYILQEEMTYPLSKL